MKRYYKVTLLESPHSGIYVASKLPVSSGLQSIDIYSMIMQQNNVVVFSFISKIDSTISFPIVKAISDKKLKILTTSGYLNYLIIKMSSSNNLGYRAGVAEITDINNTITFDNLENNDYIVFVLSIDENGNLLFPEVIDKTNNSFKVINNTNKIWTTNWLVISKTNSLGMLCDSVNVESGEYKIDKTIQGKCILISYLIDESGNIAFPPIKSETNNSIILNVYKGNLNYLVIPYVQ